MEDLDRGTKPKVSIVIPVYNGSNYLQEAIDSALAQTYSNMEVIVVNDGSNDDRATEKIALSYGERIRYFYKPNGGVATALNLGIEKMTGEYFSWLSHDDMYLPDKIEQEIVCLQRLRDFHAVIAEGYQVVDTNGGYIATVNLHRQYPKDKLTNPMFVLMRGGIQACALLIHKSHFERVGLFDPNLKTTQDIDFCFRVLRGQHFYYAPFSRVLVRGHKEQGSKQYFELHMQECDKLWVGMMDTLSLQEKKNFGGSEFDFYKDLCGFLETTNYTGAAQHAQYRMLDVAIKEYRESGKIKNLNLACSWLGISKKYLLKEAEFSIENYKSLQKGFLWNLTGPIRFLRKAVFVFKENRFIFLSEKIIRIWKRDGTVMTLKKLNKKLARCFRETLIIL